MATGDLVAQLLLSQQGQEREDEESSSSTKKKKGLSTSAVSTSTLNLALDDLGDDELIQIFCRLPTAKFAIGLKFVSKRWYSLISHPYFVSQFITHHMNKKHPNPTRVFISNSHRPRLFRVTGDHDSIFDSPVYALKFLPEEREFVTAVASCNDLLYCRVIKKGNFPQRFYICNPLTMQWFLLPPPPPRRDGAISFGLVCEPNYHRWKQGQQYECRFRAIQIVSRKERDFVDTYCSETGQWNESLQFGQQYFPSSNLVAHDGKLHWFKFYAHGVVAVYDPFNNNFQSITLDGFDFDPNLYDDGYLRVGVCQGILRFMQSVTYKDMADNFLSIWELEDYASRRLSLKHKIFYKGGFGEFAMKNGLILRPLACHPNIKDVVYLGNCVLIIQCKIQNGELEVIDNPLDGSGSLAVKDVLTAVIPWWPTPLPKNSHIS